MNNVEREILLDCRYLNFPVKCGAARHDVSISVDGTPRREFAIELAEDCPDFWAFVDMSEWVGKTAVVRIEGALHSSWGLDAVECLDEIKDADLYHESLRPLFHFSAKRGWMNDPNGLLYYNGEYHLFFQHNPYGTEWGYWDNMQWGHAVSTDLLHWEEMPEALHRKTMAVGCCYSGSAVVDELNSAGFQTGDEKALIALFTDSARGEAVAYSNDCGRTWIYASCNPVLQHEGRDPKVFWYAPGKHWVMAVYDVYNGENGIAFFTSSNLKTWSRESFLGNYYECPDIYALPIDGDPRKVKWILSAADGSYRIGSFDGKTFIPETDKVRYHCGECYYAAQTFNNIPESDGRRIQIAWAMGASTPGMPFNQCMLMPVRITLHSTADGLRLRPYPVKEVDSLRANSRDLKNFHLDEHHAVAMSFESECLDVFAECSVGSASWIIFNVRGVPVMYDALKQSIYCLGCVGPIRPSDGKISLRILVDRTTLEIFGNDGELYMPLSALPDSDNCSLKVSCDSSGYADLYTLSVYEMRSVWE